jgi:hypothetical protein
MSRRLLALSLTALTALLAFAAAGPGTARAQVAERATARLQVGADEFFYSLSRARVRSGRAIIQLVNYGEDDHNLRFRRVGSDTTRRIGRTAPGQVKEFTGWLRAGRFDIWCALPGHAEAGMVSRFRAYRAS